MQHPSPTLYCPNPTCQAPNGGGKSACKKCGAYLPHRYLVSATELGDVPVGDRVGDRYYCAGNGILLDTQPGLLPETPEEIPAIVEPYLRLFPYRLHVPQAYGFASANGRPIWLLERGPVAVDRDGPRLQPELFEAWPQASPMRQLHWLWQMARLWQPFRANGVASSLLSHRSLRVEGRWVRLLRLSPDREPPSLKALGQHWCGYVDGASGVLRDFIRRLCQQMRAGEVRSADQVLALLDRALALYSRDRTYTLEVCAQTDRGPSRARNEDACYPESGRPRQCNRNALAIVCDGVGGHEGGDVASHTAIEEIERRLRHYQTASEAMDKGNFTTELEESVFAANRAISDRNNSEQRQGRQRMGTTLVMALVRAHEAYITHVGDSRAYAIGPEGCYQITLDDDVATRDVRLGYAFYRDALQQVAAGSLVQALGMGPSSTLYPTVERFILDDDCAILLCSDGLSDYDRVEQHWRTSVLPALEGKWNAAAAARKLVEVANTHNGHDNVTVAVVRVRIEPHTQASVSATTLLAVLDTIPDPLEAEDDQTVPQFSDAEADAPPTVAAPKRPAPAGGLPVLLAGLLFAIAAGLATVLYRFSIIDEPQPEVRRIEQTAAPAADASPNAILPLRSVVESENTLTLRDRPSERGETVVEIPWGSTLQVLNNREMVGGQLWVELQVCTPGADGGADTPPLDGITGWVDAATLDTRARTIAAPTTEQLGNCPAPDAEVEPSAEMP